MGAVLSTLMAPATTLVEREAKKNLHGALMIWAWGVFIPSGILLATYGRDMFGGGMWFKLHRALGVAGVVLGGVGLLLARQFSSGSPRGQTHRLLGYLVTLVGLSQPVIAYYRPDPKADPSGRETWFAVHKWLGWLSLLLGLYNIRTGLQMWDPKDSMSTTYQAGVVAAGAVVAAWHGAGLF